MQQALTLAQKVARESVSDPDLLRAGSVHTNITDYQRLTRYMAPSAIADLKRYVRVAYKDVVARGNVSALAFTFYSDNNSAGAKVKGYVAHVAYPDTPFTVLSLKVSISPKVTLDPRYHYYMTVTGSATAEIAAHETVNGKTVRYVDVLTEQDLTYGIAPTPSSAAPVSLISWHCTGNAIATRRR